MSHNNDVIILSDSSDDEKEEPRAHPHLSLVGKTRQRDTNNHTFLPEEIEIVEIEEEDDHPTTRTSRTEAPPTRISSNTCTSHTHPSPTDIEIVDLREDEHDHDKIMKYPTNHHNVCEVSSSLSSRIPAATTPVSSFPERNTLHSKSPPTTTTITTTTTISSNSIHNNTTQKSRRQQKEVTSGFSSSSSSAPHSKRRPVTTNGVAVASAVVLTPQDVDTPTNNNNNNNDGDSDNSSLDELLNYKPVFTRKKQQQFSQTTSLPPATTTPSPTITTEESSSTGILRIHKKTPSSTRTPRNPYARSSKVVTAGSRVTASSSNGSNNNTRNIQNPCAKSQSTHRRQDLAPRRLPTASPSFSTTTTTTTTRSVEGCVPYPYPTLSKTHKVYPDVRPHYILAFWKYARRKVQNSYDRGKLDQIAKKIVMLALTPHPIRTLEEYCFSRGVGGGSGATAADRRVRDELRSQLDEGGLATLPPIPLERRRNHNNNRHKKYYSIAEACLVALLDEIERRWYLDKQSTGNSSSTATPRNPPNKDTETDDVQAIQQRLTHKQMWVSLQSLIPKIDNLLMPACPGRLTRRDCDDHGASYYATSSTRSAEFLQIAKLETPLTRLDDTLIEQQQPSSCGGSRIKRHTQKGQLLYELTALGYNSACRIRQRQFPLPPGHYRCSRITMNHYPQHTDAATPRSHITHNEKYNRICLGVDRMEGGGGSKVLHEMCNKLDMIQVPYFVGSLSIGDYVFFTPTRHDHEESTSCPSTGIEYRLCPILVERKSIEDVAMSIHDGRWKSQKRRMYAGQYVFGYQNSTMVYIIEGKEETQQVTGGYIGHRRFNVDMDRLKTEIENLQSEGFEVIRTPSRENTMFELARWAQRVADDIKTGRLTAKYTYEEFKDEVKKIPTDTDFSRMAKYAMSERIAKEAEAALLNVSSTATIAGRHVDSDIQVLDNLEDSAVATNRKCAANKSMHSSSASKKRWCIKQCDSHTVTKKPKIPSIDYSDWSVSQLKEKCKECGLAQSGSKPTLVERLNGPHPPKVWLRRKQQKEYVPERHNVASSALLVALYLHEQEVFSPQLSPASSPNNEYHGLTKDELYVKAEALQITKNPFSGGTTQTGPFHYDGWSSMSKLLAGDPALVIKRKNRYKLTRSSEIAGYTVARAMHEWCHAHDNCPCGNPVV